MTTGNQSKIKETYRANGGAGAARHTAAASFRRRVLSSSVADPAAGAPGLEPCVAFEFGEFPLLASRREVNGRCFLWLANNEAVRHEFILRVKAGGGAEIWNCEDGSRQTIALEALDNGEIRVALTLAPCEAFWLVFDPAKPALEPHVPDKPGMVKTLDGLWTVGIAPNNQPCLAQRKLATQDWLLKGDAKRQLESWLK